MKTTAPHAFAARALAAALACTLGLPAQAQPTSACAEVEVHNVRPQQGHLMVAAYGDAESYRKQPMSQLRLAAGDSVMRFQLCGLSGDAVALALFQDLDGDGKMGRNLVGMPSEPWGSSGTPGPMGPTWGSGRVPLDGRTIVVKMAG
jgi:uncharacterized protein (DUF2141 family)